MKKSGSSLLVDLDNKSCTYCDMLQNHALSRSKSAAAMSVPLNCNLVTIKHK